MPDITRPALSGLSADALRELYTKELGAEVPADLTSAEKVKEAIKSWREANPIPEAGPTVAVSDAAQSSLVKVDAEGREHEFPRQLWNELGETGRATFRDKAEKPAELS